MKNLAPLEQHVALSVAAAVAYHQITDGAVVYDGDHLATGGDGMPRALTPREMQDLKVRRGATRFRVDGSEEFTKITVLRGDLRDAIAILKAVGLPAILGQQAPKSVES